MVEFDYQLRQLEKRRSQLWFLALLLIIVFALVVALLSYWGGGIPANITELVNYNVVRISLILLSVAFCVYVIDREVSFRKLERNLFAEKVKSASLDNKVKQVSTLLKASKAVNDVLEFEKRLNIVLKSAFDLLAANKGSIMLLDEKTKFLKIVTAYGLSPDIVAKTRIKLGESIAGWVALKGKSLLLNGDVKPRKYKNFTRKAKYIQSAIVVPLKVKDKNIGVLSLSIAGKNPRKFDKYDLNTAQLFAEQVATTIVNSKLYEQANKSKKKFAALNKELADKNKKFRKANIELKSANEELEKFNKLTIDRELEMIKLKEEIKKYKNKVS